MEIPAQVGVEEAIAAGACTYDFLPVAWMPSVCLNLIVFMGLLGGFEALMVLALVDLTKHKEVTACFRVVAHRVRTTAVNNFPGSSSVVFIHKAHFVITIRTIHSRFCFKR